MTEAPKMGDALADLVVQVTSLHFNLGQDVILITEDKVRLCLIEHVDKMEAKKDWIAPAGVLFTLIATFATTTFRDNFLKAATWEALFVLATVLAAGWLLKSFWKAFKAPTIEDVVTTMKRAAIKWKAPAEAGDRTM